VVDEEIAHSTAQAGSPHPSAVPPPSPLEKASKALACDVSLNALGTQSRAQSFDCVAKQLFENELLLHRYG
jgi:hypothetical protein